MFIKWKKDQPSLPHTGDKTIRKHYTAIHNKSADTQQIKTLKEQHSTTTLERPAADIALC